MLPKERIKAFHLLGESIKSLSKETLDDISARAGNENAWFTPESVENAISGIGFFLQEDQLIAWSDKYDLNNNNPQKIGIIAAGNIPLVGFHDVLCVLLTGHQLLLKMSSDDRVLMLFVLNELYKVAPEMESQVNIVDRLNAADVYIATGSDNTARYFEQYFKGKPSIIRRNRSSIAVLTGKETKENILNLGRDIFQYFGLGCRNISKIFVPNDFDFIPFLDSLESFKDVLNHHKYCNNYDYNKSIYLVNGDQHLDNGFLLVKESEDLVSPISVLYYQKYSNEQELNELLQSFEGKTQCVLGAGDGKIPFGEAQQPELWDYADGVDTMQFLVDL